MRYAGFAIRLAAYIADGIILFVILICVGIIEGTFALRFARTVNDVEGMSTLARCFGFLATPIYFVVLWTNGGQTLGMRAFGIKIVQLNGQTMQFGRACLRYLGYVLSGLIDSWFGISLYNLGSEQARLARQDCRYVRHQDGLS